MLRAFIDIDKSKIPDLLKIYCGNMIVCWDLKYYVVTNDKQPDINFIKNSNCNNL